MDDTIEIFDENGKPLKMPRAEYARQVLSTARQYWDNLDALRQIIMQMMQQGFYGETLQMADRACELSNGNVNDLYWRAAAMAELGRLDEAAAQFAELQEDAAYETDQARAATGLARVRARQGHMEEASQLLDWALETDTRTPAPLLSVYGFWAEQKDPEKGLMKIREAMERNPASASPHRALAQIASSMGNRTALLQHGRDAIEHAGSDQEREEILAEITWIFGQSGMFREIIDIVEPRVFEILHPHTMMNLAQAYEEVGDLAKSRDLLAKLREGAPAQIQQFIDYKMDQLKQKLHE